MIVDCHTHIWDTPRQLGHGAAEYLRREGGGALAAGTGAHWAASEHADLTLVLGFHSRRTGADISNQQIAEYIDKHPDRLAGLAGVDPTADGWKERLAFAVEHPRFIGVTVSPDAQGFHPADSRAWRLYEACARRGLVVVVHQGAHFAQTGMMEYARPILWDEVLRDLPNLKVIFAHLGHPWIDETLLLLRHPRAFADIASLIRKPWCAWKSLIAAHEHGVMDKLLFGSDFPFLSSSEAIECVYRTNEVTHGTRLPSVPRESLRGIVERDVLALLDLPTGS